jgi:hypothetical protein
MKKLGGGDLAQFSLLQTNSNYMLSSSSNHRRLEMSRKLSRASFQKFQFAFVKTQE